MNNIVDDMLNELQQIDVSNLSVARMGEPILRRASMYELSPKLVKHSKVHNLISAMKKVMQEKHGVGLAAPQVFAPFALFVIDLKELKKRNAVISLEDDVIINPVIKPIGEKKVRGVEACLSLIELIGYVSRYKKIKLKYMNIDGIVKQTVLSNYIARVVQHETDHLHGILWIDRVDDNKDIYMQDVFMNM